MNGSGWATAIAWLVVWLVFSHAVDQTFIKSAGAALYSGVWQLPISSINLGMYIAATDARLGGAVMAAMFLIMIGLLANAYQVYYNTMVGPIRMFFAMAFDRGLPDKFTIVHSRWHTPVYVIWLACACAVIQIYLSSYLPEVAPVFLPAALSSGCIPYTFTSLAGAVMPWRGKAIYEASPAAKYKVGPIPLVTITGLISVVFNLTMIYYWLTNPALGINPYSMIFVFFFYIVGLVWFIYWRWHRKRQGIDLSLSFRLVPPD
jgi:amino acid transporter